MPNTIINECNNYQRLSIDLHAQKCLLERRQRERDTESAHLCKRDYGERIGDLQIITLPLYSTKVAANKWKENFPTIHCHRRLTTLHCLRTD